MESGDISKTTVEGVLDRRLVPGKPDRPHMNGKQIFSPQIT